MKSPTRDALRVNRSVFQVTTHSEADRQDRDFWHSRTPIERLQHLERLRELNYGSEVLNQRLQRVLALLERSQR
jgi:hypothetical protein